MLEAILLDRDGVINRERVDYVKSWQEFEILPGAQLALTRLARLQLPILVVSNQSAIGRGAVSAETVDSIHQRLKASVEDWGGRIDGFYVCPHHPDEGCQCRKPKPGLLIQAAHDHNLDLGECVFVGDSWTDFQAADAVGCRSILVRTGRQGPQLDSMAVDRDGITVVADLTEAVSTLVGEDEGRLSWD